MQEATRKRAGTPKGGVSGSTGSTVSPQEIPDKLYFRIGEVAKLCAVPAYVLRFWESEFPQLRPNKGGTGQRLYRRRDVEMALRIKVLLYDEGYTIAGARQAFKAELRTGRGDAPSPSGVDVKHLEALRKELGELHALLSRPAGKATPGVQPIRMQRPSPARTLTPPTPFPVKAGPRAVPRSASLFADLSADE